MGIDRGKLLTEQTNPASRGIHRLTIDQAFDVFNEQDQSVAIAVREAKPQICAAIKLVSQALTNGGRLLYVGAGTSGRLGVIDAAECPPTFMSSPDLVQGIIAGGPEAMRRSIEGAEDDCECAAEVVDNHKPSSRDVVMGISTGGTTPFVHSALTRAMECGAKTILLTCVSNVALIEDVDVSICVLTGPEVIAGSTRLKAGTATKMVLNMISSIAMIQLGKVYDNLMVDLNQEACCKLRDRAVRIVALATAMPRSEAQQLLTRAGSVKAAIVMNKCSCSPEEAMALLRRAKNNLAVVLDQ